MDRVSTWRKLLRENGNLNHKPLIRRPRKLDYQKLKEYVEKNPDNYLREMAEVFKVGKSTIRKALIKMKITLKKRPNYTENGMRKNVRSI
ncbi:MAG: transposase, partial [Holosporales bacterium]|nr:transposase [Holosporales bacterium]